MTWPVGSGKVKYAFLLNATGALLHVSRTIFQYGRPRVTNENVSFLKIKILD